MTDATMEQPDKTATTPTLPVAAGSPSIDSALSYLLGELDAKREVAMAISNFTSGNLINPQHYIVSGTIVEMPLQIDAGQANALLAIKPVGVSAGTAAVVTYDIEDPSGDSQYKLAVLWSVPFDYAKHGNRFNFALLDVGAEIDQDLYAQMLKGAVNALHGEFGIKDNGFQVNGVMSTDEQASFKVGLRNYSDG